MEIKPYNRIYSVLQVLILVASLLSCSQSARKPDLPALTFPDRPDPMGYVCYRTDIPITVDGTLDEKSWSDVPENQPDPVIESTLSAFESYFPLAEGPIWTIYQDGRIVEK
jgi:hypothetical protein